MPETVCVACKLPNGILLKVSDIEWIQIKDELVARESNPRTVLLRGSAEMRRLESGGNVLGETTKVSGGYGLTHNVPRDFWDRWVEENKEFPPYKKGLIFAHRSIEIARDSAKEQKARTSGMEPLVPDSDPRTKRQSFKIESLQREDM